MKCPKCRGNLGHIKLNNSFGFIFHDSSHNGVTICSKCKNIFRYWFGNFETSSVSKKEIKINLKSVISDKLVDINLPILSETYINNFNDNDLVYLIKGKDNTFIYNYTNVSYYYDGDYLPFFSMTKPSTFSFFVWSLSLSIITTLSLNLFAYTHAHIYEHSYYFIRLMIILLSTYFLYIFYIQIIHRLFVPSLFLKRYDYQKLMSGYISKDAELSLIKFSDIEAIINNNTKLIGEYTLTNVNNVLNPIIKNLTKQNSVLSTLNEDFTISDLRKIDAKISDLTIEMLEMSLGS